MKHRKLFASGISSAVLGLSLLLTFTIPRAAWAQDSGTPQYHLVKKVVLGGEGGWDYFKADPKTHRIFIGRGTYVMVVNPDGSIAGKIDVGSTNEAHAVEFAPNLHKAFTSNGGGSSITIFDPDSLKVLGEVKIKDRDTDGILYDPSTKRVFTFNGGKGNDATAIDAVKGEVVGSIPLGGKPESAQTDGEGHIYVNMEDSSMLKEIDARTLKVVDTFPLAPCATPAGQAIDMKDSLLIVGCRNKMMDFWNYKTHMTAGTVPIGAGNDANRFDPGTSLAFASTGDGHITVAKVETPNRFTVIQTLDTMQGARTMALDTGNHNVYTVTTEFGPAPAPTADNPHPRPKQVPNSFTLIIYSL